MKINCSTLFAFLVFCYTTLKMGIVKTNISLVAAQSRPKVCCEPLKRQTEIAADDICLAEDSLETSSLIFSEK